MWVSSWSRDVVMALFGRHAMHTGLVVVGVLGHWQLWLQAWPHGDDNCHEVLPDLNRPPPTNTHPLTHRLITTPHYPYMYRTAWRVAARCFPSATAAWSSKHRAAFDTRSLTSATTTRRASQGLKTTCPTATATRCCRSGVIGVCYWRACVGVLTCVCARGVWCGVV